MHPVQGRLRDVQVAAVDELLILPEEEGQQQGADVRAVHVGVGHDDDLVIAQLVVVGVVLAYPCAHGRDEGLHFLVGQHLVEAGALGVQDLAAQRQDGLGGGVAALLGRTACGVTFHDEQFRFRRVLGLAVGQLAGQRVVGQGSLAAHQFLGAAGGVAGSGGVHGLVDDQPGVLGVFAKVHVQLVVHDAGNQARDFAVAQLGLGLALELGLRQLDGHHRGQALAHVIAGQHGTLHLLDQVGLALDVAVDGAGERRLEPGKVCAAFLGADVVGEGEHVFLVARVVLQREVHGHPVGHPFTVDDGMDAAFAGIQVLDELADAAIGAKHVGFRAALVGEFYFKTLVEVRKFLETLAQRLVRVLHRLEDFLVRLEVHRGAVVGRFAQKLQRPLHRAARKAHAVALAVAAHGHFQPLGKGVHAAHAHAVQAARHLVGVVVELAARVQLGHDDLDRGLALLGVQVDRDAAAVVADRDAVIEVQLDHDARAVARHGLVDGVVHHLVHKVVQAPRIG
ncbi:hypothetical protein DSECCO2_569990 [anaerobic digester metagenome]